MFAIWFELNQDMVEKHMLARALLTNILIKQYYLYKKNLTFGSHFVNDTMLCLPCQMIKLKDKDIKIVGTKLYHLTTK